ncbi:RimK family alpha-L-glutamate ligase [Patescibacteria group bacterium]|nr:RimK family alpha-L-glutamate ligase [Patescibacteria group bacterium]
MAARKTNDDEKLIMDAARRMGHKITLIRAEKCHTYCGHRQLQVFYNNKPFPKFDAIIPRVSALGKVHLECIMMKHLELLGHTLVNRYYPCINAKNKLRTLEKMVLNNILVPKTISVTRNEYLDEAITRVGGVPVVLKTPFGSLGVGVAIVESKRSLQSSLDIFWGSSGTRHMLIQEYIKESNGKDIRVFVVGGKIVAAMERTAQEGDFRSNINAGGAGATVELTYEEKKMALKATKVMKLQISGVDILRSDKGPLIMEVNCNPGLKGITEVTGLDIGGEIVKFAVGFAKRQKAIRKK